MTKTIDSVAKTNPRSPWDCGYGVATALRKNRDKGNGKVNGKERHNESENDNTYFLFDPTGPQISIFQFSISY